MVAPKVGAETTAIASKYNTLMKSLPNTNGTTRVTKYCKQTNGTIIFCDVVRALPKTRCRISQANCSLRQQIDFVTVNIDDPKNAALVEEYGVSPIPTLLFLDKNSQVVSYLIGFSDESTLNQAIQKLL